MYGKSPPRIREGQGQTGMLDTALEYLQYGWNVIPLQGKRPALRWRRFQQTRVSEGQLRYWYRMGQMENIGLVCGAISNQLVIFDIDSPQGYRAVKSTLPHYTSTYTVRTGSGMGYHLYWYVQRLPKTTRVKTKRLGNLEILSTGCQAVAPPSRHPTTGRTYEIVKSGSILRLDHLRDLLRWLVSLRETRTPVRSWSPIRYSKQIDREEVVTMLTTYFLSRQYRRRGAWLNGTCVYPHRHNNDDSHPSFGFNVESGFGYCFVCGTLTPHELCQALNMIF